ncbi:MAG: DUF1385 domain-containing protein [Candidatus Bipolaricaulota bacterium]|nr:DUF1385 domain-containing protein [Candidatus Bipolaricaulota bacterium]MDW8126963.1 DUF1385 domain-containing protein [Candidatus Bipolaricaulota bacterium]
MPLGGQAVIEGVLIADEEHAVLAVRNPNGAVVIEPLLVPRFPKLERIPLVRGPIKLYQLLSLGLRALQRSAEIAYPEEKSSTWDYILAVGLALLILLGGFIALPFFLASRITVPSQMLLNLVEGGIRVAFFTLYLWGISFLPDVRRVFQYHGAEHKVVHAYEKGTPELPSALKQSPIHARCGTNFVFLFVVVAVLVFSLIPTSTFWTRLLARVLLIPVVAAITYELLLLGAKGRWLRPLLWPGLLFQKLTTREPAPEQIEVALAAVRQVLAARSPSTTE